MNITIDPAATKILNTLNKSATIRGIQEDYTTIKTIITDHIPTIRQWSITRETRSEYEARMEAWCDNDTVDDEFRAEAENERRSNEEARSAYGSDLYEEEFRAEVEKRSNEEAE